MVFVILTLTCNLGEKCQYVTGSICLHYAIKIGPVSLSLVLTDLETKMYLTEEIFLMVVITITTFRDILGTLIEQMETLEGKTVDSLITKEISPTLVHLMQTSKMELNVNNEMPLNMFKKTKNLTIHGFPSRKFPN